MAKKVDLRFTTDDLNLVLMSLGQLPYLQVHELIARIQAEAGPQLLEAAAPPAGAGSADSTSSR